MIWTPKSLSIGGSRAVYLEYTARDAADVLVLLHAFPVGVRMWESQAIPTGWRAIAPAMPGFDGATPAPEASSNIADYAQSVIALLDALRIESAVIGGLSLGGYVAFALWRLAPRRFRGLLLADTRAGADSHEGRAGREKMLKMVRDDGPGAMADQMIPKLLCAHTRSGRPDIVSAVRRMIESQTADGIAGALRRLRDRPDSTPLLSAIDVPVVVIAGEDDELTPPNEAERLASGLPNARLEGIAHAGHLSNVENPEAFDAALARFLAAHFSLRRSR